MKKAIAAILCLVLTIALFVPAVAEGDNILRVYTDRVYRSFNQVTASDGNWFDVSGVFSEGLIRFDGNNVAQPGLAYKWDVSEDGLTYTFYIREGLTWSNGDPITAKDFEFSFLTEISDADANGYATTVAPFLVNGEAYMNGECEASEVGVKAIDDYTFQFVLTVPAPYFLCLCSLSCLFPLNEKFYTECGESYGIDADHILYCGPFVATSLDVQVGCTLVKNPNYWDAENVKLDGIEVKVITDASAALTAYQAGEIDRVNLSSIDVVIYNTDPEFGSYSDNRNYFIQFNVANDRLNAKMRQALSCAIDRETLVNEVLMTGALAAGGVVSRSIFGDESNTYRNIVGDYSYYNPELAKQLWEEGVAENGGVAPTDLVMLTATGTDFDDMAVFVQDQFRTVLGIEVTINAMTQKARNEIMKTENYDFALNAWGADYDDAMTFLDCWMSGTPYRGNYASEEYRSLINQAKASTDAAERIQLMGAAEKLLCETDCAVAGLYDRGYSYLMKDYVKGYIVHPSGTSNEWKYVSLEK